MRSAIASARVLEPSYQIPLAVVTNCRDAEVLDTYTGKVIGQGMDAIPGRKDAGDMIKAVRFEPFADKKKIDREKRILNAYDIESCCAGGPCALPGAPEG